MAGERDSYRPFRFAFSATGATTYPNYFTAIAGDFDGDGIPDIATANSDLETVGIYITRHTQTAVATASSVSIPGSGARRTYAAYPGDTNYTASNSATASLTGSPLATTLTLASSASTCRD